MTSSSILSYPIEPVATLPIDERLAQALLSSLAEYGLQLHSRRVWLACSGGRDSLALATLCVQLYRQSRLPFLPQLLHVNHGLQAANSIWAQHVAQWADVQQIPCRLLSATVHGHDEQAARQARYEVMRAQLNQDDVLLLAHHADDQAETVLMRLIQGAGVNGLSGMRPWHVQQQDHKCIVLWRPWLSICRDDITRYATRLQLPYIDDPTNDSGENVRSGLRCDVMPLLKKYNPNVIDNIARSAQLLGDAQAIISAQAAADLQRTVATSPSTRLQQPPAQRVLAIEQLQKLPIQRQRQLLHQWLSQDEPLPPSKQLVDDVLRLAQRDDGDHQTELFWQGTHHAYTTRRYRQQLYRLSKDWLAWLQRPLDQQMQKVSLPVPLEMEAPKVEPSEVEQSEVKLTDDVPVFIPLRDGQGSTWRLSILPTALVRRLVDDKQKGDKQLAGSLPLESHKRINNKQTNSVEIVVTPLQRQQRLKTALASRPQAGKKLYQTLGIPVWLRDSLVVVSIVINHQPPRPLLLISPFERWVLGHEHLDTDFDYRSLTECMDSHLTFGIF